MLLIRCRFAWSCMWRPMSPDFQSTAGRHTCSKRKVSDRLQIGCALTLQGLTPEQHDAAGGAPASECEAGGQFEDTEPRVIGLEYSSSWSDRMAQTLNSLQEQSDLTWRLLP
jgi:hypothetical protein